MCVNNSVLYSMILYLNTVLNVMYKSFVLTIEKYNY